MSVAELSARHSAPRSQRLLCGWGRTARSSCRVFEVRHAEDVLEVLAGERLPGAGVIARGAGRSYGDAAQNGGGDVLDMTKCAQIISIDIERMLVRAEAGATIAQLMARLAAPGLGLPVLPGTRHVTLAGAIASDIHGKNHHRDGAFARHVVSLKLCTPSAGLLEISPESDPELFYATLGGMGLTGIILEATLKVERLPSPWVSTDSDRTAGLAETLELLSGEERHRYSVAWLDLLAPGPSMGRAIISRADPLESAQAAPRLRRRARAASDSASLTRAPRVVVPQGLPDMLHPLSVRAFNALRWRAAPRRERGRPQALAPYFFPLDALGEWNRLYGPRGLIQYQLVIPAGQESALEAVFALVQRRRVPVYLAVFKRFGAAFGGPLSFPLEGWTLALDIPAAAPGLEAALEELDQLVAGCGGRVYLTKDARLRRELLEAMYPQLDCFASVCERVDPEGVLRSDLSRRLGLGGAAR